MRRSPLQYSCCSWCQVVDIFTRLCKVLFSGFPVARDCSTDNESVRNTNFFGLVSRCKTVSAAVRNACSALFVV